MTAHPEVCANWKHRPTPTELEIVDRVAQLIAVNPLINPKTAAQKIGRNQTTMDWHIKNVGKKMMGKDLLPKEPDYHFSLIINRAIEIGLVAVDNA